MREVLQLVNCNEEFLTRSQGERVRERLVKAYDSALGDQLVIDFSGVEVMTPSFADECFGKLAERVGFQNFRNSVSLTGGSETVRALVNSVLAQRGAASKAEGG